MANNLLALRKARGWKQDEAATALGTALSQYAKLERGERRLSDVWIERAAAAYGVDPAEVVRGQGALPVVGHAGRYGVVSWLDGEPAPGSEERALAVEPGALGELFGEALLVFRHERRSVGAGDLGRPVLLAAEDGEVLIRRLLASPTPGRVHAVAAVGPALFDVLPAWVSPLVAIRC